MPMADTEMEDAIFVLAAHVVLKTSDYLLCLDALARLLGPARLQYAVVLSVCQGSTLLDRNTS